MLFKNSKKLVKENKYIFYVNIVACMRRLYKTGIGLTTGFIGSHTVTHNYSVYTLTASQFTIVLAESFYNYN
jgi:hypothetical protein